MKPDRLPVVVLISGRGSNLKSILDAVAAGLPAEVCAVISNRPGAGGLAHAAAAGVPTEVVDHTRFATREAFEAALTGPSTATPRAWWCSPASCACSGPNSCATTGAA